VKSILVIVGLCIALMVGVLIGNHLLHADREAVKSVDFSASTRLKGLQDQLNQLSGQFEQFVLARQLDNDEISENVVAALSQRIEELTEAVAQLQSARNAERLNEDQTHSYLRNDNRKHHRQETKQTALERENHIDETFAIEVRDEIWANSMSNEITEALQKPELAAGRLTDVDCRSTMCRVEVLHDTRDSAELFEFENHLLVHMATKLPNTYTRKVEGPDGLRTVMLFVREGEQLPQLENGVIGQAGQ